MKLPPELNFAALRGFYAVARTSSFGKAAALLRVQQPAISKMVRTIERDLGLRLFRRTRGGVELTAEGTLVADACERLFDDARTIEAVARRRSSRAEGEVFLATNDHVATYLLPRVVEDLRRDCPEVVLRISTGPAHLFVPGFAEGRPEIGLFFKLPAGHALDALLVARAPCQIVVRAGLEHDERVLRSFIGSREMDDVANKAFPTLRMLDRERPGTRITVSCNGLEAHKTLVQRGVGISILPLFTIAAELASGELRVVHPAYVFHAELHLVARRGTKPSRATSAFVKSMRRHLGGLGLTRHSKSE